MGQDKKQLRKLLLFVKDLYDHPDNIEFSAGIREMVLSNLDPDQIPGGTLEPIKEIYEYCIQKVLKEQAEDMYKNFSISEIAQNLSELYVDMENSRRNNDIAAFGFYLFKQLELITGTIVKEGTFVNVYEGIKGMKPFSKYDRDSGGMIRIGDKSCNTVEELIQIPVKNSDGTLKYKNLGKPLADLNAQEKIRAIIYLVILNAEVNVYHPQLLQDFSTLSSIYNLRNYYAHSGVNASDIQHEYLQKILEDKTQNALKYLNFLLMFIQGVSNNYPFSESTLSPAGVSK